MEVSALLEHWLGWDDKNHHCSSNIGDSPALHSEIETSNSMTNHSVMTPNTKSSLTGLGAPSWADRLVSHLVTGSNPTDDQQNEDPSIWVRKFCSEVGCDVLKKQDTNGKTLLHHLLSGKNSLFSGTQLYSHKLFVSLNFTEILSLHLYTHYTNSLVNADSFYENFTITTFQKIPIPHLTRPMRQKFLH